MADLFLAGVSVLDMSRWQGEVTELEFEEAVKAGMVGLIQKFTQGTDYSDKTAAQNEWASYTAAVTGGRLMMEGAYHFGVGGVDPEAQAKHFYDTVRAEYPTADANLTGIKMALDLEGNASSTMPVDEAVTFINALSGLLGRLPLLYMGRDGPDGRKTGLPNETLSKCDLWLPKYGPIGNEGLGPHLPPGIPDSQCRLWQWTDGTMNGGSAFPGVGKVDQSRILFPDLASFQAWWMK